MMQRIICTLTFIASTSAIADLSYSKDELRQMKALEQQAKNSPDAHGYDLQQAHKMSDSFKAEAIRLQQQGQAIRSTDKLASVLQIPEGQRNPEAIATGVMVFTSLTMPDATLKQLLKQSEQLQVPLIIRGVLPQGFPATAKRIIKLLDNGQKPPTNSGFAINPNWFKQFNIQYVPAFVSIKQGHCLPKTPCHKNDYDIVYGNISLYEALEILRQGDAGEAANNVLSKFEDQQ